MLIYSKEWLLLLLSVMAYTLVLSIRNQSQFNIRIFLELNEFFLGVSTIMIEKIGHTFNSLTLTVVIWYLSATVIQMSFSSLLRGVYFLRKPSLTANTLEDLVDNPELRIAGYFAFKELKDLKPDIYSKLEPRVREYDTSLKYELHQSVPIQYITDPRLVKDIVDRKAVLMINSYFGGVMAKYWPGANLMLSDTKYAQQYTYIYATKSIFKDEKDAVKFQTMWVLFSNPRIGF